MKRRYTTGTYPDSPRSRWDAAAKEGARQVRQQHDLVEGLYRPDGRGQLWLVRRFGPNSHTLRNPQGHPVDLGQLGTLRALGGVGVRLHMTTGEVLSASLGAFEQHGAVIDRENGRQVILPDAFWERQSLCETESRQPTLSCTEIEEADHDV